ncbi:hypothetical protein AVEN_125305-1, partial [Araneus ventricosus]
ALYNDAGINLLANRIFFPAFKTFCQKLIPLTIAAHAPAGTMTIVGMSSGVVQFSTIAVPLTDALNGKCRKVVVGQGICCESITGYSVKQALTNRKTGRFILRTITVNLYCRRMPPTMVQVVLSQVPEDDENTQSFTLTENFRMWREEVLCKWLPAIVFGIQRLGNTIYGWPGLHYCDSLIH